MISPLRILMLYRHDGLVQTQALYSMEAPWLPKSESGTRSPSLHLRHRGKAFSTKSPPSFSREDSIHLPDHVIPGKVWRRSKPRGSLRLCIRIPTAVIQCHSIAIIPQIASCVSILHEEFFIFPEHLLQAQPTGIFTTRARYECTNGIRISASTA